MRIALGMLVLLSTAGAQADATRLIGTVRGADGSPWPDVDVTLHSEPAVPLPGFGSPHTLTARTDARGRFRAILQPGRSYAAWATRRQPVP